MKKKYLIIILIGFLVGSTVQVGSIFQKNQSIPEVKLTNSEEKMLELYEQYTVEKISRKDLFKQVDNVEFKNAMTLVVNEMIVGTTAREYSSKEYPIESSLIERFINESENLSDNNKEQLYLQLIESIILYRLLGSYVMYINNTFQTVSDAYKVSKFNKNHRATIYFDKKDMMSTNQYTYVEAQLPRYETVYLEKELGTSLKEFHISATYMTENFCKSSQGKCLEISDEKSALFSETSLIRYFE